MTPDLQIEPGTVTSQTTYTVEAAKLQITSKELEDPTEYKLTKRQIFEMFAKKDVAKEQVTTTENVEVDEFPIHERPVEENKTLLNPRI